MTGTWQAGELVQPWFTYLYANPVPTVTVKANALWPPGIVGSGSQYDQFLEWDIANVPPGDSQTLLYTVALDRTYPVGSPVSGNICVSPGAAVCDVQRGYTSLYCGGLGNILPFLENPPGFAACVFAVAGLSCWEPFYYCMEAIQGACDMTRSTE